MFGEVQKRIKNGQIRRDDLQSTMVGNLVLVKLLSQQFKAFRSLHKGIILRYEGPFEIVGKMGKFFCRLNMPDTLKIHPMFPVSMLKPYHDDANVQNRGVLTRAPPVMTKSYDKEIKEVLASKEVRKRGVPRQTHFLIKWKGLPETKVTWVPEDELWQFRKALRVYSATKAPQA